MSEIKGLIASDIDGTLLDYECVDLPKEVFDIINQLYQAGFAFCPSSGRQYSAMRKLFEPVADKLYYICENGAVIVGNGSEEEALVMSGTAMKQEDFMKLAQEIMELPDCDVIISGKTTYYLCGAKKALVDDLASSGAHVKNVDTLDEIKEKVFKVTLFSYKGEASKMYNAFAQRWGDKYDVAVSGAGCLDFTVDNKGIGLREMCRFLGVDIKDTIAFGDNWNDVSMLETAGTGYIMSSADNRLLQRFPKHCRSVTETLKMYLTDLT